MRVRTRTGKTLTQRLAKLEAIDFANIVKDDIQERFDKGLNIDSSRMTPLKKETIAIKKRRGGIAPSKPLIFKGGSKKGVKTQRISRTEAIVYPTGNAKGYYGGSKSSKEVLGFQRQKGRNVWGVSELAKRKIRKSAKDKLLG